jgi:hypothetical protein
MEMSGQLYALGKEPRNRLPDGVLDEVKRSFNSSKTPAGSNLGEYYQILQIQLSAPGDGQKHLPKHGVLTRNNKLTYIVAFCWLLS